MPLASCMSESGEPKNKELTRRPNPENIPLETCSCRTLSPPYTMKTREVISGGEKEEEEEEEEGKIRIISVCVCVCMHMGDWRRGGRRGGGTGQVYHVDYLKFMWEIGNIEA